MASLTARARVFVLLSAAQACVSAPAPRSALTPLQNVTSGASETFGPGLVGTADSGTAVTFALSLPASVVLVRLWPGLGLEQLYPANAGDTTSFSGGVHTVRIRSAALWSPDSLPRRGSSALDPLAVERLATDLCFYLAQERARRGAAGRTRGSAAVDESGCRNAAERRDLTSSAQASRTHMAPAHYLILVASDHAQDARHLRMRLGGLDFSQSTPQSVLDVLPGFLAGADATIWAGYVAPVLPH
jgi:hypothetical protein